MPTPTGLPKVGEVWKLDVTRPGCPSEARNYVILERTPGDLWSVRIGRPGEKYLWITSASWYLRQGWLTYQGPARPDVLKSLGLG
jgi:hypothetical protein